MKKGENGNNKTYARTCAQCTHVGLKKIRVLEEAVTEQHNILEYNLNKLVQNHNAIVHKCARVLTARVLRLSAS